MWYICLLSATLALAVRDCISKFVKYHIEQKKIAASEISYLTLSERHLLFDIIGEWSDSKDETELKTTLEKGLGIIMYKLHANDKWQYVYREYATKNNQKGK